MIARINCWKNERTKELTIDSYEANAYRIIFLKKFIKTRNFILIKNSQGGFTDPNLLLIWWSTMKHPNKWAITELLVYECFQDNLSIFNTHIGRNECKGIKLLTGFIVKFIYMSIEI